jgi:hypothetical protein
MYQGDLLLQGLIVSTHPAALQAFSLNASTASQLALALGVDAAENYYSAAVSVGDAIGGINRRFFSWATVKLYYSAFYAVRSLLASEGHCLFHVGKKPKWIHSHAGAQMTPALQSTHLTVLRYFEKNYPTHPLVAQPIGTIPALQWLYDRRLEANYTNSGFGEPEAPSHFERISSMGVRRAVEAYMADGASHQFDADHSMLALPLLALKLAHEKLVTNGREIQEEGDRFLKTVAFKDGSGPIPRLRALLNPS